MPIDIGTTTPATWVRGAAAGGHAVTLSVSRPDGTPITPAPDVTETAGTYTADILCDQPGRYVLRWSDDTEDGHYVDTLEVWPADPRFLISAETAYQALKWRPADITANGESLRLLIAAATEVIEDITGAILLRDVTQLADGGRTGVLLWERPTGPVTVTVDGKPYSGHVVNPNAAIVYASPSTGRFPDGRQNIALTYQAGADAVSPSIQLAASELVRHLWQVGRQSSAGGSGADTPSEAIGTTRSGFAVPNRVIQLCSNRHALPGIG